MRYLQQGLLAMLLLALLTACGGGNAATPGGNPTAAVPTPQAPAVTPVPQKPGTTKITFWYGLGGLIGNVLQTVVNEYNESQDKYYVEAVFQSSYEDTLSKFSASLAGGGLPNLVQVYELGTQRMIDSKKIVPVQDFIERDKLQSLIQDLEPAIRDYYTIDGKMYSMPFNSSTAVIYINKKAFVEAGLDPEKKDWTWEELADAAKKLTKKDASGKVTQTGLSLSGYGWYFEQQLAIHNMLYSDPGNGREERAQKYVFNNEIGVKWLELMKSMIDDGSAKYYGANATDAATSAYTGGEAAMTFASIASLRNNLNTTSKGDKVELGVIKLPRSADAKGRNLIGGASLWITNQSTKEQQEGSWDFIKFVTQPEMQAKWSANTGYVPVQKSSYDLPEMQEFLKKYPQLLTAVEQLRTSETTVFSAGSVTGNMLPARNFTTQAMDNFWSGKVGSAQEALDDAAQKATEALEEYNLALQG